MAGNFPGNRNLLRQLTICGTILLAGYVGLFCLMQAPAFWYNLRPDPIRSLIPEPFAPLNQLFPDRWNNLDRTHRFALISVPMYLAIIALITAPLLYLLRRFSRLSRGGISPQISRGAVLRRVFGFTVAIMFVLMFQRGLLSSDIYSYTWYSRIWVEHRLSPYTHPPVEFLNLDREGSIHWVGWQKEPAVYGPAWMLISSAFYRTSQLLQDSFSAQLLSLRLLADLAHLLNGALVWAIAGLMLARKGPVRALQRFRRPYPRLQARTRWRRDARLARLRSDTVTPDDGQPAGNLGFQTAALLFYLWNPLLLVEFAGNGHNDVLMLTFVLAAIWLYLKGMWQLGALALGVAALVKLPALMFVPGYLWLLLWDGVRASRGEHGARRFVAGGWRAAQSLGIIVASWVLLYLPFWEGPRTLLPLVSGPANREYLHTLPAAIWWNAPEPLANLFSGGENRELFMESARRFLGANVRLVFLGLLGVVALLATWKARTFDKAVTAWGWVAIAAIMAQGWFWPWYVSWAIVPAVFSASKRLRNATLIFIVSALLHYIEEQILAPHFKLFLDWSGVLIMAPPLVYLLVSWLADVRRNSSQDRLSTSKGNPVKSLEPDSSSAAA